MNFDDIQIYLPKYLSSESSKELFEGLKDFPDSRLYTSYLQDKIIYQGDGLMNMLAVNLPNIDLKPINGLVLSNTCDMNFQIKDLSRHKLFILQ